MNGRIGDRLGDIGLITSLLLSTIRTARQIIGGAGRIQIKDGN